MLFTDQIREHALKDAPNEACGFIFRENGAYIARPCTNVCQLPAENPAKAFRMPDNEVLSALRSKALVGLYHSHTNDFKEFGEADIKVSETLELPSYLFLVPSNQFKVYYPKGQKIPLLGRPYVPFIHDCIEVVRDFFKETHGIDSPRLNYAIGEEFTGKKNGIADYFTEMGCKPVSIARENDIVLMMIRCHNFPNHVGVLMKENMLLHHPYGRSSTTDPYNGFWKKCTSGIFRHPQFLK